MTPERLRQIREALANQPVTNGALGWAHDLLDYIDEARAEAWAEGWEAANPAFEHYAYNPYNGKIH